MKIKNKVAIMSVLALSTFAIGTKVSAFGVAHTSPHVAPHVTPHVTPHEATPHVAPHEGTVHENTATKGGATPSAKVKSPVVKETIGKETVTNDNGKIKNKTSNNSYNKSFYTSHEPHVRTHPSFWSFYWLWGPHSDINRIRGIVVSKDGNNKLTIDDKQVGHVQVTVSPAQYSTARVGKYITIR